MTQFVCFPPLEILRTVEIENEFGELEQVISVYKAPRSKFRSINAVAIHALDPSEDELERHIEDAAAKGFDSVIVYAA
jgi:hypothetical protein